MKSWKIILYGFVFFLLAGCCCPNQRTVFVLLPDPDGKIGSIEIRSKAGTQVVDKAGYSTEVTSSDKAPTTPKLMNKNEINETFGEALAAEPQPPAQFNLLFLSGSTQLTSVSTKLLPKILSAIKERKSFDINVIGHTDLVGSSDYNTNLSLKRAQWVRGFLVSKGVDPKTIEVLYYGETKPFIKTDDEVAEPRNRRVTVIVR